MPQQTPKKKTTTVLDTPVNMEIGNDFVEVIHDSKRGTAFFTNLVFTHVQPELQPSSWFEFARAQSPAGAPRRVVA